MYNKFIKYIRKENLFTGSDRILIAASGGKDSMVLIDLLYKAKFDIGIAHFNHVTRRGESDRDQEFVREFSMKKNIPFFTVSVDVKQYLGGENGNNFQNVAREKRYNWLEKIRIKNNYDYIATAHHKNDNVETFLYRAAKGSGLKGLTGIKSKNGFVIRPMLSIPSSEIEEYVKVNKILFVEDSSNLSEEYNRNFIRHNIVSQFNKLHPNFIDRISITIDNLLDIDRQFDFLMDAYSAKYICQKKERIVISKAILDKVQSKSSFLFFLLQKYGFNKSQILDILQAIDKVGALFSSKSFELLVDRVSFIVRKKKPEILNEFTVSLGENVLEGYGKLYVEVVSNDTLNFKEKIDYLDFSKIKFPLTLRNWRDGDRFKPFGLKGRSKKIKDYFTDKKMNRFDKDDALLLINNGKICAILRMDISYEYRVKQETKEVLKVKYIPF